ncbi:MAG: hypothetical protein G3M78_07545 [Candidatus Nitrohelix vancouverensis]|uniref:Succinylglutamate desuccinylase/Aspartoacylase catalytic domain-containing protein n=1 Tax=Candidatus Nitrohelix vancouverensis TaxID=2705534 RepID=A0A7T0C2B1_9BACT|nr:MAG: hypothetical protein G3M78_07545 [Candidatus Nitrohelix vancouverensis]
MKRKLLSIPSPLGPDTDFYQFEWTGTDAEETLSIVGGLHGDDFNAIEISSRLIAFLDQIESNPESPYQIREKIQLFPTVNPNAFETGSPVWPSDGLDADMSFPGNDAGEPEERYARAVYEATFHSTYGVLLGSEARHFESHPHLQCMSLRRIEKKMARATSFPLLRKIKTPTSFKARFFHHWTERQTPALIFCGGERGRISTRYCDLAFQALIDLLMALEIVTHSTHASNKRETLIFPKQCETIVSSKQPGLFIPTVQPGARLEKDQVLGNVRHPYTGETLESIVAPGDGLLVSLRKLPLVYEGDKIAVLLSPPKLRFWPFSH